MIKEITLQSFKSHSNTTLSLGNITILCGANGVGKSSTIQSLLLLRDTYIRDRSFDNLDLKSKSVKVGTVSDAIYEFSEMDGFIFKISTDDKTFDFVYEADTEDAMTKTFVRLNEESSNIPEDVHTESLFNKNFQYISAFRLGPQEQYFKEDKIVTIYGQISDNDGQAEYFVHFLDHYKNIEVLDAIVYNGSQFKDLLSQVIAWEKAISSGINIEVQDLGKLGYALRYSYDAERSLSGKTKNFEAINVGFGLTYVMPILVAILSAKPGALIIIENPEAHLHPNGISGLVQLLALAAQAGIQIIIETHSDHVINGILVQCQQFDKKNRGVDRNLVSLYQFSRDKKDQNSLAKRILIDENGRLEEQPDGFFDQIDKDLEKLMGF